MLRVSNISCVKKGIWLVQQECYVIATVSTAAPDAPVVDTFKMGCDTPMSPLQQITVLTSP